LLSTVFLCAALETILNRTKSFVCISKAVNHDDKSNLTGSARPDRWLGVGVKIANRRSAINSIAYITTNSNVTDKSEGSMVSVCDQADMYV
jgi:hypothetical protein